MLALIGGRGGSALFGEEGASRRDPDEGFLGSRCIDGVEDCSVTGLVNARRWRSGCGGGCGGNGRWSLPTSGGEL